MKRKKISKLKSNPKRGGPGILVTCDVGREKTCERDVLEILRHYWPQEENNKKYIPAHNDYANKRDLNLSEEISMLKRGLLTETFLFTKYNRFILRGSFHVYNTGVRGIVFIMYVTPENSSVNDNMVCSGINNANNEYLKKKDINNNGYSSVWDPLIIIQKIINDIKINNKTVPRSRFITRMLPIHATCFSSIKEISHKATQLVREKLMPIGLKSWKDGKEKKPTFKVDIHRRSCDNLERDNLIQTLANIVQSMNNSILSSNDQKEKNEFISSSHLNHKSLFEVDLVNPDYTILIEICRTLCGMSIIHNVKSYKNFNLLKIQTE